MTLYPEQFPALTDRQWCECLSEQKYMQGRLGWASITVLPSSPGDPNRYSGPVTLSFCSQLCRLMRAHGGIVREHYNSFQHSDNARRIYGRQKNVICWPNSKMALRSTSP